MAFHWLEAGCGVPEVVRGAILLVLAQPVSVPLLTVTVAARHGVRLIRPLSQQARVQTRVMVLHPRAVWYAW